jgi:signal transduction histidine kinase
LINKKGSDLYDIYYELLFEYKDANDFHNALDCAEKAHSIAVELGDSLKIVKSGRVKGQILTKLARINEAIEVYLRILPTAERNRNSNLSYLSEQKYILNSLALAYTYQASYDKALSYNFQSLVLREVQGDKAEVSVSLNNIGLVYFKLKNFEKALEYYKRSLQLKNEIGEKEFKDRLMINIGLCFNELRKFSEAQEFINKGLSFCGENCSEIVLMEAELGLAVSFFSLNKLDRSKAHFIKSYKLSKKLNDKRYQLENLLCLARIHIANNVADSAKIYLEEAESTVGDTEYNELLIEIYREFSNVYFKSKDFEKAAAYQEKYIHLKDSVYSEDLIKNIAKVQTDFEERENKAIIATKEEVIQRQHSLNIAIGVIALLACLLIFVLYQSIKVKKRVNQALSEAKTFIELKNKELDKKVAEKTADLEVANESLSKVNEELDNFIYKTSHDIRGPLASLKGICNVAIMDVKDDVALNYLSKLDITAEHLNTILTRLLIINQINNSSMKPERINFDAIVDEVLLLEKKKGLPVRLKVNRQIQPDTKFYSDKEFIRIVMENLIDNAIKFYNDSSRVDPFVNIFVSEDNEELKIRVTDNGIGISEAKPDKIFQMFSRASERSSTGGIGLYITKTATEKLGGSVGLKTTPEGYTEFYVKFPLKQQWFDSPEWKS